MQTVKIKRSELLAKVKANREIHEKDYTDAVKVYREASIIKMRHMLDAAEKGRPIQKSTELIEPVTKLTEYDRAIMMLEMSVDDDINLTSREFDCYVMDNWDWKQMAFLANSAYKVME